MNYAKHLNTDVPQSEPLPGQVPNSGGGFAFALDKWKRLERFLILGSEGGTYYASERKLTVENAGCAKECLAEDGPRAVRMLVEISDAGRAPKNDPALLVLALALTTGSIETKRAAHDAVPKVARTGTHLFHLADYVNALGGWGRLQTHAFAGWYQLMPLNKLALQGIKYQQRDGWSHRDVLRMSHPTLSKAPHLAEDSEVRGAIWNWMVKGWPSVGAEPHPDYVLARIWAFERLKVLAADVKAASDLKPIVELITKYNLPHECVPNELKNKRQIWEAILPSMGITALIRNLGKLTNVGLVGPLSAEARAIADGLTDIDALRAGRVHPLSVLVAMKTYAQGHGDKGSLAWQPNQQIVDALDAAFYLSFKAVDPTGKRHLLAIDCSDSMTWSNVAGMPIQPREAAAAMALVTANVEESHHLVGFSVGMLPLNISPRQRLADVVKEIASQRAAATDCAAPMVYALRNQIPVDTFVVYTDNETNHGMIHPTAALQKYRKEMGIPAKLVVVGMTATNFTIADPNDAGMLDVAGFDTAAPAVLADFARG